MFKQGILLLKYNKDVVCVIDEGQFPVCTPVASPSRRNNPNNAALPSHDPYIPRSHSVFYNCTSLNCEAIKLHSLTQVTDPNLNLKACFLHTPDKFDCEMIRYNHLKNVDKLVFLRENIHNKTFYLVDCLVYADKGRVCHSKDTLSPHTQLVDVATLVRPEESNILSQAEFLCEESDIKQINCDLNPYVPYPQGLKVKDMLEIKEEVLLKTGSYAVILRPNCANNWCGFSGVAAPSRRFSYEPPGGKLYRCYYAKRQQICKMVKFDRINNARTRIERWRK